MNAESKSTASQKDQELLSGGRRMFLFLGTYILGALIVTILSIALDAVDEPYRLKDFTTAFLLFFPSLIIFVLWEILPALEWISGRIFARPLILPDLHAGPFPEPANIFATLLMALSYVFFSLFSELAPGLINQEFFEIFISCLFFG